MVLENMEMVGGTPLRTTPEQGKEGDEGFMPDTVIHMEVPEAENIEMLEARDADVIPRRVYTEGKFFEVRGHTLGCTGCAAMMKGDKRSIHHSEGCRKRLEDAMKTTEQGRNRIEEAGRRVDKYFEM